ncbi:hypothetical protein B5S33_g4904 [[Candida] boidinii]|nr:hypothetical protein B5S33_g4904 [[Candida] boidinii]GMG04420.1 unnamed protein product [[Candida] boidinii]
MSSIKNVKISADEQAKVLESSIVIIKQQIALMRKCLEQKQRFMDALKHASTFLGELRTSVLTPKQYYELYILVYDGLEYLASYLKENHPNNHLADLYELVQYAGNIIPRLYLMITVGTVYMSVPDAPVKEVMKDMIEMCRGVQHPVRGLFLRYFLSQRTKDLLPTEFKKEIKDKVIEIKNEKPETATEIEGNKDNGSNETPSITTTATTDSVKIDKTNIRPVGKRLSNENSNPNLANEVTGNLQDSIQFIITNFVEMNKLWVRLQHQGHSSERIKRTKERKELQILVGSNLVRLSQLDNIDTTYYRDYILPTILEQIVQCRDVIAQEYLLDVIIQVFPDEFHLVTLDDFLDTTLKLNPEVSLKKIFLTLINRLIDFKKREPEFVTELISKVDKLSIQDQEAKSVAEESEDTNQPDQTVGDDNSEDTRNTDFFTKLISYVTKLNHVKTDLSNADFASILEGICKISIFYYPNKYSNIDILFEYAINRYQNVKDNDDPLTEQCWKLLLLSPIHNFENVKSILELNNNFENFLGLQKISIKRSISLKIMDNLLNNQILITEEDEVERIFTILDCIIKSEGQDNLTMQKLGIQRSTLLFGGNNDDSSNSTNDINGGSNDTVDSMEIVVQQEKIAKLLHLIYNKNCYKQLSLLTIAKGYLQNSGLRIRYTYPTLVHILLKTIRKLKLSRKLRTNEQKLKAKSFFNFVSTIINSLLETYSNSTNTTTISYISLICLNLNLLGAQIADEVELIDISYEFFIESFVIYEQNIVDSRLQFQSLVNIISKLHNCNNLIKTDMDNYDILIAKTALYGSKLLKKTDQCRAVYLASHLWWVVKEVEDEQSVDDNDEDVNNRNDTDEEDVDSQPKQISLKKDNRRVLECLQKSLRIADGCLDTNASLELFIEILNRSLYYFIHGNELITVKYINGLIELIQNNLKASVNSKNIQKDEFKIDTPEKHFLRTLDYINEQKVIDERFDQIFF